MVLISLPIRFSFDIDKFIASLAFFSEKRLGDLSKLKVCKLLYFADKYHLIRYGKPVIGDVYYHLDNGPVPSMALNIMDEIITKEKVYLRTSDISNKMKFDEFLNVKNPAGSKHPIFVSKKRHSFDCLSSSELEALESTMEKFGKKSPSDLIELTHQEKSWKESPSNDEIDYRLFFDANDPEANPQAKEYMEAMQENLEIALGLK